MKDSERIDSIIEYLKSFIERNNMDAHNRLPGQLAFINRAQLKKIGVRGRRFAWNVTRHSTDLFPIGLHPEDHQNITKLALLNEDRNCKSMEIVAPFVGPVQYIEHTAESFAALATREIPFHSVGNSSSFTMYRGHRRMGQVATEHVEIKNGGFAHTFEVNIHEDPFEGCANDVPIMRLWAEYATAPLQLGLTSKLVFNIFDRQGNCVEDDQTSLVS